MEDDVDDSSSMSFLDVLCGAMGGMGVLAVIFSIVKNPVKLPNKDEFILITVESVRAQGRVGVLIETPDGQAHAAYPAERQLERIAQDWQEDIPGGIVCWRIISKYSERCEPPMSRSSRA